MSTYGQFDAGTDSTEFNAISFLIQQALLKMQTVTLVEVMGVHGGGVVPTGTVDVRPLVNQMGNGPQRTSEPHGIIYGVPFFRTQGGLNAIICDPQVEDIGLCAFASRDISAVKSSKAAANPGSQRVYDWADGLYLGGFLNVAPTAYLQFGADGTITLVSPVKVIVDAPEVDINATTVAITAANTTVTGTFTVDGETNLNGLTVISGEFTSTYTGSGTAATFVGDITADGVSVKTHKHPVVDIEVGLSTIDTGAPT